MRRLGGLPMLIFQKHHSPPVIFLCYNVCPAGQSALEVLVIWGTISHSSFHENTHRVMTE